MGRLLGAQLAGRAPGPTWPVIVTYRGERLVVYVDRLNDFDVLWEVFVEKQYDDLDLPQAPGTIVDLGAHLGAALLALHVRFPGARLAAAEADPHTFRRLERTLAPLPGVRVLRAAVTDRDGTVDFLPSRDAWGSGLTEMTAHFEDASAEPEVSVRAVCFDTLMDELGLERADLVKVDIEGGEWPLAKSLNGDRVGTMIMEWHADMHGHGPEELEALLPNHSVESEPMPTPGRYLVIVRPR
jgi:FkbM family methyltransferase